MHFSKKLYKYTYICIWDGIGLGRPRPVSRPEEKFCPVPICPVPKIFGMKISRPKMPWDGTGRPGRDGTGKFEHPYPWVNKKKKVMDLWVECK